MPSPVPALRDRFPEVATDSLVAGLVPPPRFDGARFDTYLPDAAQPSQAAAVQALQAFAGTVAPPPRRLFGRGRSSGPSGVYLDGGYGVGKTHLLAALWQAVPAPKAYATFVELTHLVGALGFAATVDALSGHRLLAIDEFELDDPGDTVLVSTLLGRLADAGVRIAATSNTLPGSLGAGRFAAQDFLREIQGLAARFAPLRIDGEDYRHRGLPAAPRPLSADDLVIRAGTAGAVCTRAVTARSSTASRWCASPRCGRSPTRAPPCGLWCWPTGCTTAACPSPPAARRWTSCSPPSCWPVATARSICGPSAA